MEKEYVEKFNEIFNTEVKDERIINKIKILEVIFKALEDEFYIMTNDYKELMRKNVEISDKLLDALTEEQRNIFKNGLKINNEMNEKNEYKMFVFGYLLAKELK